MVTIVQKGADVLRKKSREVPIGKIKSPAIRKIIKDMKRAIDTRDDAVAIAAPQINQPLRMFIVSKKVFIVEDENKEAEDAVFINPVIVKASKKKVEAEEGCLSVDTWYGKTKRAEKVTLYAYDEKGEKIRRGASGLLAQIFQHEVEHLDGILFTDHATDLIQLELSERGVVYRDREGEK